MPWKGIWIIVRKEVHSNGGCTLYIYILGATAIHNLLGSEEINWTLSVRVGDCTELLGVTIGSISTGVMSIRY